MARPPTMAEAIATPIGKKPRTRPSATPPRLTCARPSLTSDRPRRTLKTPSTAATSATTRPASSARSMNGLSRKTATSEGKSMSVASDVARARRVRLVREREAGGVRALALDEARGRPVELDASVDRDDAVRAARDGLRVVADEDDGEVVVVVEVVEQLVEARARLGVDAGRGLVEEGQGGGARQPI